MPGRTAKPHVFNVQSSLSKRNTSVIKRVFRYNSNIIYPCTLTSTPSDNGSERSKLFPGLQLLTMPNSKNILISGAGIAGPALAFLLTRCGHKCTIVERASQFRNAGQQIDISGNGLKVVKLMGLYHQAKEISCGESGLRFVNAKNETQAEFKAEDSDDKFTFVKDIEIMRGALADLLKNVTEHDTEYIFGNYITALREQDSCISVSFNEGLDRDFDLVVAADGLGSKTRGLVFNKDEVKYNSLNQCFALMSIPYEKQDGTWARWLAAPGRRCVFLRPRPNEGVTGAYLAFIGPDSGKIGRASAEEQKIEFARRFKDVDWEVPRILRELKSDRMVNFYAQEVAQVNTTNWVKGRVVLLGDAGYCPSPITGQGTSLAFIGAYILAGCITSMPNDLPSALLQYEKQLRPFVEKLQKLPPGGPKILNPETTWGIRILWTCLYSASVLQGFGARVLQYIIEPLSAIFGSKELVLPTYPSLEPALVKEDSAKS
ncbi:Hypothetical protein R9X50_00134000 [Acrodontium crateriforme]|uniref:FAD-binding domain-containing protein n=1 Tax=Acrodontium crateriforme TaxID=150365 RepID=A0AAQ3LYY3_9PEZI|nr:Hypothetical protein R9X50_00134000 [Acrodontium crateriforme]